MVELPPQFKTPKQIALVLYILLGLYGSAWISDDWDMLRLQSLAYFGIPAVILYYWIYWIYPDYPENYEWTFKVHVVALLVVYFSGVYLLANAITSSSKEFRRNLAVQNDKSVVTVATQKGGLGHLFTKRW